MWSAAASRARRLRSDRGRAPARGAGTPAPSWGTMGISPENIGRAPPRRTPPRRREPRRTAATSGCSPGAGTPASSLTARIAQHAALTAAAPELARDARNSAKSSGSAGSHEARREVANPAQARTGPAYRFHVRGARPWRRASATAVGSAPPPGRRSLPASASISLAATDRSFCRRGRPARRRRIASRRSSLLRSSRSERGRPAPSRNAPRARPA